MHFDYNTLLTSGSNFDVEESFEFMLNDPDLLLKFVVASLVFGVLEVLFESRE